LEPHRHFTSSWNHTGISQVLGTTQAFHKFLEPHRHFTLKVGSNFYFMFMWPCIVTNFFVMKPTRCTNFTNLFCHETSSITFYRLKGHDWSKLRDFVCVVLIWIFHCLNAWSKLWPSVYLYTSLIQNFMYR